MITVFEHPCRNCLFSENRLVSKETAERIVEACLEEQTEFGCHTDPQHMCPVFFKRYGEEISIVRVFSQTGKVLLITRENDPLLPSFRETGREDYGFEQDLSGTCEGAE